MTETRDRDPVDIRGDDLAHVYRRHVQGAIIRSGASVVMWCSGLIACQIGLIRIDNFTGVSFAVLYLILFNLPCLWILRQVTTRRW